MADTLAPRRIKTDKPLLYVRRKGLRLEPYARFDFDVLAEFPEGARLRAELSQRRSIPGHRHYWAVLNEAVKADGRWSSPEQLHRALKWHCGLVEEAPRLDGTIAMDLSSTAFERMDEGEFRAYKKAALHALEVELGIDGEDLSAMADSVLGPDERAA
jgi:hypothetical protein